MLLSDNDILQEMKKRKITIEPFRKEQLQTNGYDVRVGPIYYVLKEDVNAFFPFVKDFINEAYERKEAKEDILHIRGKEAHGRFIRIPPHGFVIAATIERTKTTEDIAASLRCRSSLARTGISIARCAGWGDIGFEGVWTMEIVNHLRIPYYLPVGLRVGQLIFLKTESPAQREYAGKYLKSEGPTLPKLYADNDLSTLIKIK